MSASSAFSALSSRHIAQRIRGATTRVVYAAPGIQDEAAQAMVEIKDQLLPPELTVSLDFDERTLRMGYGSLAAVELLRVAGIDVKNSPGFRCGILIVDKWGWVFTPVAHYLEDEPQSDETPNAIELSPSQVEAFAVRFCPATRQAAIEKAPTPDAAAEIAELPLEFGTAPVTSKHFEEVKEAIRSAPPVRFDVVRQVRVFEPYLQYVEMHLTGAAIQKHRVQIPVEMQALGASADLEGRLKTTFDLLGKSSKLSSEELESDLKKIRDTLTPSLGKSHGRAVLKAVKPHLEARIKEFREKLGKHQQEVATKLQVDLDKSQAQVVAYYLPLAMKNPPDAVIGGSVIQPPPEEAFEKWLNRQLKGVFPKAEELIHKMILDVQYKDVTFETLNKPDFIASVKDAFPDQNWDKVYKEFRAAGEKKSREA